MNFETILYEVKDKILTITLNRPDHMNSYTIQMEKDLIAAFDMADEDDQVGAIIITGAGRAFCAGMALTTEENPFGLDESVSPEDEPEKIRDSGGRLTLRIYDCKKPVIAAINGAAVGIGITMTCAMDVRLAFHKAKMGFVFPCRGIVNEACSSWFLPRIVGVSKALQWLYSGRIFTAQEAQEAGLVESVHDSQEALLAKANEIAREIVDNTAPVSVALIRQMVYKLMGADHPMEAHRIDSRAMFYTSSGPDGKEGVASFLEKRPAEFKGRPSQDMPPFYPWWAPRKFS